MHLQNPLSSYHLLFFKSDSWHWLTQHITSHDLSCLFLVFFFALLCSASWVATMCVRSKYDAIVFLKMTASISMTCVCRSDEASTFTARHNWGKCADSMKWSHSLIFCHSQYHHACLSHACIVECNTDTVRRRWCRTNILRSLSTNRTKNVAAITHYIPQFLYVF